MENNRFICRTEASLCQEKIDLPFSPLTPTPFLCTPTQDEALTLANPYLQKEPTMSIQEIRVQDLKAESFIEEQCRLISAEVGNLKAINALSGGVDSSVTTMLANRALGSRLITYFIDNGLMREGEPDSVVSAMKNLGVPVVLVNAQNEFFSALKDKTDPEEKRQAITDTFYKTVFGRLVKESGARHLLQGTIYTDVEETVAGIKRQHNILAQLGIDTEKAYGYKVIEPLIQLRKPGVRAVGKALGMPEKMYNRPPFPGPALVARVIGEATPERIALVRKATVVVERELAGIEAFQYMAILHEDRVTGIRCGKRDYGFQIEIRCWDSKDAVTASPTRLPFDLLQKLAGRMTSEVPGVVSVTYNITTKPPSTIEAV
jgi:GMP synthase (glutamine-hydrolysing)